jgi:hypothetical protein
VCRVAFAAVLLMLPSGRTHYGKVKLPPRAGATTTTLLAAQSSRHDRVFKRTKTNIQEVCTTQFQTRVQFIANETPRVHLLGTSLYNESILRQKNETPESSLLDTSL